MRRSVVRDAIENPFEADTARMPWPIRPWYAAALLQADKQLGMAARPVKAHRSRQSMCACCATVCVSQPLYYSPVRGGLSLAGNGDAAEEASKKIESTTFTSYSHQWQSA